MYSIHFNERQLSAAEDMALRAAEEVAPILRENFGKTAHATKSNERDWVTKWDGWAEEKIVDRLRHFGSGVGFLCEETGALGDNELYWTIDAIDGTSGFVRGIDTCTTMISLVDSGRPVVAVIYDFMRKDAYSAVAGVGSFKNRVERMHVSDRDMKTAYLEAYLPENSITELEVTSKIKQAGAYMLQSAAAGYMFTSIARGATEGFVSLQNPYSTIWDYAPGALLVHEAGGVVANVGSTTYDVNNPDLIASNRVVFDSISAIVRGV